MGTHLVTRLVAEGHDTAVIDMDREVTERIFAEHGVVVFTGSATDLTVLEQAGLKRADVAVAMTGRDEANLAFCLLARYFGVPRVLARMLNPQYEVPYRLVGATKIHSEADILVGSFLTSIEYPQIGALMPVGKAELVVFELKLPATAPVAGKTIAEIVRQEDFPRPCLFIGVETATGLDVADGNTVVQGGTTVLMAARRPDLPRVLRCLTDVGAAGDDPDHARAIQTLGQVPFLSGVAHDDLSDLLAGVALRAPPQGRHVVCRGPAGRPAVRRRLGAAEAGDAGRPAGRPAAARLFRRADRAHRPAPDAHRRASSRTRSCSPWKAARCAPWSCATRSWPWSSPRRSPGRRARRHATGCAPRYRSASNGYAFDRIATSVTARPTAPAVMKTSAMPRPIPVPNQPPMS